MKQEEPDLAGEDALSAAPLGGTRAESMQRLQVGVAGLAAILLMIGLASVITDRARETEASTVPEAASTTEPSATPAPKSDPLAEAGVVPDLPAEPAPTATQEAAILPEKGEGLERREE
ncbi:MAG: hypothetical protein H6918_04350 [Sphingomonadaceae bacterium]|nr:hypothetical protein [Sphingomonadaceae bacterium]